MVWAVITLPDAVDGDRVDVIEDCRLCGERQSIVCDAPDWTEWQFHPRKRMIQDIFPYLTADQREMLQSRTCGACFDGLFPDE